MNDQMFLNHLTDILNKNSTALWVLLALAGLDLVIGTAKALLNKRFQSVIWRQTLSKLLSELGLPATIALLGVVNPNFQPLVGVAIGVGLVTEAVSVLELLRGKNSRSLDEVIKMVEDLVPSLKKRNGTGGQT
ncbi:phage holin family protein [Sulfobacillus thermosulfidooxidans]|uniref:phage holin family protein n=1 Tax=Sulfobacillus thermosulfidooxidans TaxID=28034 RepID=UPI00035D158F|nr:phage holin family protein [Sulfobacillus thermosulfidooxidans]